MNKRKLFKMLGTAAFSIAFIFHVCARLFGYAAVSMRELKLDRPLLIGATRIPAVFWVALTILFVLYLLYSWDLIGRNKSEYARQYLAVADVGLVFSSLFHMAYLYCQHKNWHFPALLFALLMLLILMRVAAAYGGNPTRPWFGRIPFDFAVGWMGMLVVWQMAVSLASVGYRGWPLSETAWAVLLLILAALVSSAIGLRFLAPTSLLVAIAVYSHVVSIQLAPDGMNGQFPAIYITAILCMAWLLAIAIVCIIKRRRKAWR